MDGCIQAGGWKGRGSGRLVEVGPDRTWYGSHALPPAQGGRLDGETLLPGRQQGGLRYRGVCHLSGSPSLRFPRRERRRVRGLLRRYADLGPGQDVTRVITEVVGRLAARGCRVTLRWVPPAGRSRATRLQTTMPRRRQRAGGTRQIDGTSRRPALPTEHAKPLRLRHRLREG